MGVLGLLINHMEQKEIEYLVKRELEELLMDLEDCHLDQDVKQTIRERYKVLFKIFQRVAAEQECLKYMLKCSRYT